MREKSLLSFEIKCYVDFKTPFHYVYVLTGINPSGLSGNKFTFAVFSLVQLCEFAAGHTIALRGHGKVMMRAKTLLRHNYAMGERVVPMCVCQNFSGKSECRQRFLETISPVEVFEFLKLETATEATVSTLLFLEDVKYRWIRKSLRAYSSFIF